MTEHDYSIIYSKTVELQLNELDDINVEGYRLEWHELYNDRGQIEFKVEDNKLFAVIQVERTNRPFDSAGNNGFDADTLPADSPERLNYDSDEDEWSSLLNSLEVAVFEKDHPDFPAWMRHIPGDLFSSVPLGEVTVEGTTYEIFGMYDED